MSELMLNNSVNKHFAGTYPMVPDILSETGQDDAQNIFKVDRMADIAKGTPEGTCNNLFQYEGVNPFERDFDVLMDDDIADSYPYTESAPSSREGYIQWRDHVDPDGLHYGDKSILAVMVDFDFDHNRRDLSDSYISAIDIIMNHAGDECDHGGGFIDNTLFNSINSKVRVIKQQRSIHTYMKAMSGGVFDLKTYIFPEVIILPKEYYKDCTPWMGCDWANIVYVQLKEKCPECFTSLSPSGRPWFSNDQGLKNMMVFHPNLRKEDNSSIRAFVGSFGAKDTLKSEGYIRYFAVPLFGGGCIPNEVGNPACDNVVAAPSTTMHELGHLLFRFKDLYDYSYKSQGVGKWDLMGLAWGYRSTTESCNKAVQGETNNGAMPTLYGAALRLMIGWAYPISMERQGGNVILESAYEGAIMDNECIDPNFKPKAVLVRDFPDNRDQVYIFEFRRESKLEPCMAGAGGLLLWHIDYSTDNNDTYSWPGDPKGRWPLIHYGHRLVQGDNRFDLEKMANSGDSTDIQPFGDFYYSQWRINSNGTAEKAPLSRTLSTYQEMKLAEDAIYPNEKFDDRRLSVRPVDVYTNVDGTKGLEPEKYALKIEEAVQFIVHVDTKLIGDQLEELSDMFYNKQQRIKGYVTSDSSLEPDEIKRFCIMEAIHWRQKCVQLGYDVDDTVCLADCVTNHTDARGYCGYISDRKCNSSAPKPKKVHSCGDFLDGVNGWTHKGCSVYCEIYQTGKYSNWCTRTASKYGIDIIGDIADDPYAAAQCAYNGQYTESLDGCSMKPHLTRDDKGNILFVFNDLIVV